MKTTYLMRTLVVILVPLLSLATFVGSIDSRIINVIPSRDLIKLSPEMMASERGQQMFPTSCLDCTSGPFPCATPAAGCNSTGGVATFTPGPGGGGIGFGMGAPPAPVKGAYGSSSQGVGLLPATYMQCFLGITYSKTISCFNTSNCTTTYYYSDPHCHILLGSAATDTVTYCTP